MICHVYFEEEHVGIDLWAPTLEAIWQLAKATCPT